MPKPYEPPKQDVFDHVERTVRALATLVPGGSALMTYVQTPVELRRGRWMDEVAEGLRRLEEKIGTIDPETLVRDERFVSALLQASYAAIRTHLQEKREALRNAVLNVAAGSALEDDLQMMFIGLVDVLSVRHLQMLKFYEDPGASDSAKSLIVGTGSGAIGRILEAAVPNLRGRRDLYDLLHEDLVSRGVVQNVGLQVMMTAQGLAAKRTTVLGDAFLKFIASPIS